MHRRITCLFALHILLLITVFSTCAQSSGPYLLLQKAGSEKRVVFNEGEEIRFKIRGESHWRRDHIAGLHRDTIRFHYYEMPLADISVIDIGDKDYNSFHFDSGGDKVIIAGMLFMVADYMNQKVIQDEPGGVAGRTFIIGGSIVTAGILMKLMKKRRFRPGGRYILDIIDLRQR